MGRASLLSCTVPICHISFISLWLTLICCTLMLQPSVFKKVVLFYVLLAENFILFCRFDRELYHSKPQNIFCNLSMQNTCYNQFFYYFSEKIKIISQKARYFSPMSVFMHVGFTADCEYPCLFSSAWRIWDLVNAETCFILALAQIVLTLAYNFSIMHNHFDINI